jgi:hypothetical protein
MIMKMKTVVVVVVVMVVIMMIMTTKIVESHSVEVAVLHV